MEKCLAKSEEKIQKICDALRRETLEPARQEAEEILRAAKEKAAGIIAEANAEKERIIAQGKESIEKDRRVFMATLRQAGRQSVEKLKQDIERVLFNKKLRELIVKETVKPEILAGIISAIVTALKKDGLDADLEVIIPKSVAAREVSAFLGDNIIAELGQGELSVGDINGGIKVKLVDRRMTLDFSDQAIFELISGYVRKDFRELIFGNGRE